MEKVVFCLCAAIFVLQANAQVVQPGFEPQHMMPPQHQQMMEHQRAQPESWHVDHEHHLQMAPQHSHAEQSYHSADDQQLGAAVILPDPFHPLNPANPFSPLNPLNPRNPLNKFNPLNPFNPLRIPGAKLSHLSAGHVGPFMYGNTLLGAGNPMEMEDSHLQAEHQQLDTMLAAPAPCSCAQQLQAPMPAEYHLQAAEPAHYNMQAQEPQHYNLQAPAPAGAEYYLQEPQHYHLQAEDHQLQAPMQAEYNLQDPMQAEYNLQEAQHYNLQAEQAHYNLQAQQPAEYHLQQAQMPMENVPFPSHTMPEPLQIAGPVQPAEGQRTWGDWKNLWNKKDYDE